MTLLEQEKFKRFPICNIVKDDVLRRIKMIEIPNPNTNEVEKYLKKWDSLENYVLQENSLDKFIHIHTI